MSTNTQPHAERSAPANPKLSKRDRPKWNVFKNEVHQIYIQEDKTLSETMKVIEQRHGFTASARVWKSVMKEWGFDKNLSSGVMKFIITKQEKRLQEEGKETVFLHGDSVVTSSRIENFRRRKTTKESEVLSPVPATPAEITYGTPHPGESVSPPATNEQMLGFDLPVGRNDRERSGYNPDRIIPQSKNHRPLSLDLRPPSLMTYSPTVAIWQDSQEHQYFQYFCDKTSKEICGAFDPVFWTEKIPQLCYQAAPIRHASIALGALAKSLEITSLPTRLSLSGFPLIDHNHLDEHYSYALSQYKKAIGLLRMMLSDGRRHLRISLTSCVLFMSFEALQGSYECSLIHLRGGSRLLTDWRLARRGLADRLSQDSRSEIHDGLVDDLGRMFARFDIQGLLFPPPFPMPELRGKDIIILESFDSTQEAREIWDFLMCGISQFYQMSVTYSQQNAKVLLTEGWIERHEHYTAQLLQWRSAFQLIFAKEVRVGIISTSETTMLSIYYNLATILLAASVQHTEALFDDYTHLFAEIISGCNYLLSNTDNPTNTSRFTLDMGTILPLAITAMKCRDKRLRHQAIALLWSSNRREGLCFDTITVARLCAWISSIEGFPEDDEQIPDSARWVLTHLKLNSKERWLAAQITPTQIDKNGKYTLQETTFSW